MMAIEMVHSRLELDDETEVDLVLVDRLEMLQSLDQVGQRLDRAIGSPVQDFVEM